MQRVFERFLNFNGKAVLRLGTRQWDSREIVERIPKGDLPFKIINLSKNVDPEAVQLIKLKLTGWNKIVVICEQVPLEYPPLDLNLEFWNPTLSAPFVCTDHKPAEIKSNIPTALLKAGFAKRLADDLSLGSGHFLRSNENGSWATYQDLHKVQESIGYLGMQIQESLRDWLDANPFFKIESFDEDKCQISWKTTDDRLITAVGSLCRTTISWSTLFGYINKLKAVDQSVQGVWFESNGQEIKLKCDLDFNFYQFLRQARLPERWSQLIAASVCPHQDTAGLDALISQSFALYIDQRFGRWLGFIPSGQYLLLVPLPSDRALKRLDIAVQTRFTDHCKLLEAADQLVKALESKFPIQQGSLEIALADDYFVLRPRERADKEFIAELITTSNFKSLDLALSQLDVTQKLVIKTERTIGYVTITQFGVNGNWIVRDTLPQELHDLISVCIPIQGRFSDETKAVEFANQLDAQLRQAMRNVPKSRWFALTSPTLAERTLEASLAKWLDEKRPPGLVDKIEDSDLSSLLQKIKDQSLLLDAFEALFIREQAKKAQVEITISNKIQFRLDLPTSFIEFLSSRSEFALRRMSTAEIAKDGDKFVIAFHSIFDLEHGNVLFTSTQQILKEFRAALDAAHQVWPAPTSPDIICGKQPVRIKKLERFANVVEGSRPLRYVSFKDLPSVLEKALELPAVADWPRLLLN